MSEAVQPRSGGIVEFIPRSGLPRLLLAALHERRPAQVVAAITAWAKGAGTPECPLCNIPRQRHSASGFIVASCGSSAPPTAVLGICEGCACPPHIIRKRVARWLRDCGTPAAVR